MSLNRKTALVTPVPTFGLVAKQEKCYKMKQAPLLIGTCLARRSLREEKDLRIISSEPCLVSLVLTAPIVHIIIIGKLRLPDYEIQHIRNVI
jgi:hypothetical protein